MQKSSQQVWYGMVVVWYHREVVMFIMPKVWISHRKGSASRRFVHPSTSVRLYIITYVYIILLLCTVHVWISGFTSMVPYPYCRVTIKNFNHDLSRLTISCRVEPRQTLNAARQNPTNDGTRGRHCTTRRGMVWYQPITATKRTPSLLLFNKQCYSRCTLLFCIRSIHCRSASVLLSSSTTSSIHPSNCHHAAVRRFRL